MACQCDSTCISKPLVIGIAVVQSRAFELTP